MSDDTEIADDDFALYLLSPTATIPTRGSDMSVGYDIYADLPEFPNGFTIGSHCRAMIPTGLSPENIPAGTYGRVAPRSGAAKKHGLDVLAGVVDPDYRGEIFVLLLNTDPSLPVVVRHGERIAQIILTKVVTPPVRIATERGKGTRRGAGGFGSTGS